ncbi:MAG: hypothetical protein K8S25_09905 [Alphaproteobacteria bacterium]|nr:hypothetical protein [Alphaproteobacteria bacterium]
MRLRMMGLVLLAGAAVPWSEALAEDASFSFSTDAFRSAFNRQAARDRTDQIADCVLVHRVSGCTFRMKAFKKMAAGEALAAAKVGGEMPDEQFDIVDGNEGRAIGIDFYGNSSTPMRRAHYIGQFKSLLRVLKPGISRGVVERIIDDLGLRLPPKRDGDALAVTAGFADMSCRQGEGAYINCNISPRSK